MTSEVPTSLDGDSAPSDDLLLRVAAQSVAEALRIGKCPADHTFDRFLPDELRALSGRYWTPIMVARRAALWLDKLRIHTVVDIGSGVGKFCVTAALAGRCHFIGLEQRSQLVASARALARLFAVDDRVSFVEGALGDIATPVAEAYYLYNPFGEYVFGSTGRLEAVSVSAERYAHDVAIVEDLLEGAAVGTCVVTYNGFGGRVPSAYRQIRVDRKLPSTLCLWRKKHDKIGGQRRTRSA